MGTQRWCFFNESQSVCLPACRGSIWDLAGSPFTIKGRGGNLRIHLGEEPLNSAEPSYPSLMEGWQRGQRSSWRGGEGEGKGEGVSNGLLARVFEKERNSQPLNIFRNNKLMWKFLSWLRVSSALWWWNTRMQLKQSGLLSALQTRTHTHMHYPLPCGKHDWERPMAGGMGESVPHVERGNILQKFTANLNLMGHSLSLRYSFWCRWALMKWELRPRSHQNCSSGAPHGWATKGHGVKGQTAWHITGWDMYRVVTGKKHQFLTSNSTFKNWQFVENLHMWTLLWRISLRVESP